jgi:hypothetical protein
VGIEVCFYKYIFVLRKQKTYSAVLLVSVCHTPAYVYKISVFRMYEMTASISDSTGLLKHATLYITCTACQYEIFPS